jgi:hypothetical protein
MSRRTRAILMLGVGLLAGAAVPAFAQETAALRGTLTADDPAAIPAPTPGKLADTSLEIQPAEPVPPTSPRRRAAADPYAPNGIGTGGLRFYPSLTVGSVYTSNVNSSGSNPQPDAGLQIKPALRFESDWVRHSWTGGADGSLTLYADRSDLDSQSLNVFQRLRLDVRRDTTAEFSASYGLAQTGIGNSSVPATAKGLRTEHTIKGEAAVTHDFGGLAAALKAGTTARIFEDVKLNGGGVEDNRDRDYVEPSLSLRTTFTDLETLRPYVEASYTRRIHTLTYDRYGLRRDSDGFGVAAGFEISRDALWTGDFGITYLHRSYADPFLAPVGTIGLTGSLTWNPTEITKVVMSAGTSISEVSSATRSADPVWTAGIAASHALRDNIDLTGGASIEIEDTGPALDLTYDANLGLSWKLNPYFSWTAGYNVTWLDSGTAGRSYVEHRLSTGLTYSP